MPLTRAGEEQTMGASTMVWIIVAVAVVVAGIALVVVRSSARRAQAQRQQSADVREKAVAHDRRLREAERPAAEAKSRSEGYDQRRTGTA